ncbi:MAG: type restriction enzyme subunit [Euryarchaeota archaeon]|nr:type restriction enzyme subunit [Euryarchaeota archaeon]
MPERSEVPEGWLSLTIQDVCDINPPKPKKGDVTDDTLVTFVPMPAVDAERGEIASPEVRPFAEVRSGFTAFRTGDVIMAKITPCMENGKAAIADGLQNGLGFGSTEFFVLRSNGSILPQYLFHYIRQTSFRELAESNMAGSVGQKRVPKQFIANAAIALPPLPEQHRIVAAIEALFARLDAANARLERVPGILKQFRQAVLAAACDGRLTEDWRAENPNRENGSVIISRIVAERKHQSVIGNKNKERIVTPKIIQNGYEEYFEIPSSWLWVNFGTVLGEIKNGISIKPHNDPPGDRILRISALRARNVNLSDYRYLRNSEIHIKSYQLEDNDLLFTRYSGSEEFVGICGLVRGLKDNVILYPDKLIRVRFDHQQILPNYVELFYLNGFARQMIIDSSKSSAGQRGISGKNIRDLPLALPPLPEQHEIVRRVDALFALADKIEAEVAAARAKTETMRQSILAQAFSGRLVPTEAELARREEREYEPASVLLERIRSGERAKKARQESQSTLT